MIDTEVSAERRRFRQLFFVACRCDDAAVKQFRDLNRGNSHPGAAAENQYGLSLANSRKSDKHVPRRHENQRHAGCLIEIERVWNWNDVLRPGYEQFAIPAVDCFA